MEGMSDEEKKNSKKSGDRNAQPDSSIEITNNLILQRSSKVKIKKNSSI